MKPTTKRAFTVLGWAVLAFSLVLTGVQAARAQQFNFTTTDVPNAVATGGRGIDSAGDTVGLFIDTNGDSHGYLHSGGGFTKIDFPQSQAPFGTVVFTSAEGINDSGAIVGFFEVQATPGGPTRDFSYLLTGFPSKPVFHIIDFPAGLSPTQTVTLTHVHSINRNGDIVGFYLAGSPTIGAGVPTFPSHGFKLTGFPGNNAQFTNIDFPGAAATLAFGINDEGAIVGVYSLHNIVVDQAFLLAGGTFTPLATPAAENRAWGINDNRQIVGFIGGGGSATSPGGLIGDLLSGSTLTLIMFPGSASTLNFGINRTGQIVGGYFNPDGKAHGFVATPTS